MTTTTLRACGQCVFCRNEDPVRCIFPTRKRVSSLEPDDPLSMTSKRVADYSPSQLSKAQEAVLKGAKKKGKNKGFSSSSWTSGDKCAYSHPALKIAEWFTVYGGAAGSPIHKDCDIYVSLNGVMPGIGSYPWEEGPKPLIIDFYITDMNAPKDPKQFKKMITWLVGQAKEGKKIHIGCQGGHGRTGTVLAALVKEAIGEEDAITFVREGYCKKAVESSSQMEFLHEHYGIKKLTGSKSSWGWSSSSSGFGVMGDLWTKAGSPISSPGTRHNAKFAHSSDDIAYPVLPVSLRGNIWGITK